MKRLREFLKADELDPDNTDWRDTPPLGWIRVTCIAIITTCTCTLHVQCHRSMALVNTTILTLLCCVLQEGMKTLSQFLVDHSRGILLKDLHCKSVFLCVWVCVCVCVCVCVWRECPGGQTGRVLGS